MVRSISTLPLVQPAATTPDGPTWPGDQGGGAFGIDVRLMVCSPARSASAGNGEARQPNLDGLALQALRNSSAASSFTFTPTDSGDTSVKSLVRA